MLRAWDSVEFVAMITMFNEDGARSRSHGLRPAMVAAQGDRLGLEQFSACCSWDTYTNEYTATLARLPERGVTHVVFGDIIQGNTHREWNERVWRSDIGLTPVMPLWAQPTGGQAWSASSSRSVVRHGSSLSDATSRPVLARTDVDGRETGSR